MGTSQYTTSGDSFARFGGDMSSRGTSSYDGSVSTQGARVRLLEDGTLVQASPGGFGGKNFGAYPTSARHGRRSVGMVIAFIVVIVLILSLIHI